MGTTRKLKIRDLTLRDGQQSLFATRMSQKTIDRLIPLYDDAGFEIMEVWGGAVPDSVMRYLDESPWERLRSYRGVGKGKSKTSALSRGRNLFGYVPYPDEILRGFYKHAFLNGLGIMRVFDALNDLDNVRSSIKMINELGGIPDGAVCYTVDPKDAVAPEKPKGFFSRLFGSKKPAAPEKIFTDDYFVEKAKALEAMGAKIVTLKDMAGLVTPMRAASIIGRLKQELKVPVDFHTHCTPGYGLASSVMAIINGVDILDTNIWWFGEGSAAPAIELIYIFAKKLGVELDVNMKAVGAIRKELLEARKSLKDFDLAKRMPIDFDPLNDKLPAEVDALFDKAVKAAKEGDEATLLDACHAIEAHFGFPAPNMAVKEAEVPGGMYSNMVAQLKALGASELLDDALKLIPKVRRDAGLVPLVTPTSQIVGSQAVSLALDRKKGNTDYSNTSKQFIALIKGEYGHTPAPVDPQFRNLITGSPEETPYNVNSFVKPENPALPEMGGVKLAKDDEEYLLLMLLPSVAVNFLKKQRSEEAATKAGSDNGAAEEQAAASQPVTGPVVSAPMGGRVISISVKPGDAVKKGQVLMVYEAMKMENEVEAPFDGVVKRILVKPDEVVGADAPLIEFEDK